MIPVDLPPGLREALRAAADPPPRHQPRVIETAIAAAVRRLVDGDLEGQVRPWDLPALRDRAVTIGEVRSARVVSVDDASLVAELSPGGQRLRFRAREDGWRLVRFVDDADTTLHPETTRHVDLVGWGPDAVLTALGQTRPEHVELEIETEDLGQGETETTYRYRWTDGGRSVLAEEVTREIYDGATPTSSHVRGVVVDGDRGVLLTGSDGTALIITG